MNNDTARNWLFRLLMRRSYTCHEAARRLKERGVNETEAAALLSEAQEMGLLDDATYARLFAESHGAWGNRRIDYELGHRGVSDEDIQAALEGIASEEERLLPFVASWRESGLEERKIVARFYRRGFSGRAIRAACQHQDDDDLEESDYDE